MTKKDIVALADALRIHNRSAGGRTEFTPDHLLVLADFCGTQYPTFNRERWIDYIAGVSPYEGHPKRGPRQTANREQQEVFLSLLRQLRKGAGLRQIDIAKALHKPKTFVGAYETGARRLGVLELLDVCDALGISLGVFVREFEKRVREPGLPALSPSVRPPRRLHGRHPRQQPK